MFDMAKQYFELENKLLYGLGELVFVNREAGQKDIELMASFARFEKEEGLRQIPGTSKASLSKLAKVHEIYLRRYGMKVEDLKSVSPYSLYDLYNEKLVNNKTEAYGIVNRLKAGETTDDIRNS